MNDKRFMINVRVLADFTQNKKTLIHERRNSNQSEFDIMHLNTTTKIDAEVATTYSYSVFSAIQRTWNRFVNTGVDSTVPDDEVRYIHFTNIVALITVVAAFAYVPYSLLSGHSMLAGKQLFDACSICGVIWLNHKRRYVAARYAFILIVNSFILTNAVLMGRGVKAHEFFYVIYMVPFLLFRVKDYLKILLGIVIVFSFFSAYFVIYPHFVMYNLSIADQEAFAMVNMVMKFLLFGIAVYILAYYNYSTEKELERLNYHLNQHSIELERSNADLEQFAYIISHDLRTPVRNISSFLDLLAQRYASAIDKNGMDYIDFSRNGAVRLSKQIEGLLIYSRIGKGLPPVTTINVNDLVTGLRAEMHATLNAKQAKVIQLKPMPLLAHVHSNLVMQLFRELVSNGIKFNHTEHPEVKLDWMEDEKEFTFKISDNGIGIDKQYTNKLFQIFRRLHAEGEYEGSGTGLAICKKIISMYKGNIWFDSEPGQGSTFYFTIPKEDPFEISLKGVKQAA